MTIVVARPGRRRHLLIVLVGYIAFLAWVVFWPSGDVAETAVLHITRDLYDLGLPGGLVSDRRVEFALNVLVVAPLAVLGVFLWPRATWERWTAYAFVGSCAIELFQGLFLPMRAAQFADVVANTLGAGLGAVVGHLLVLRSRPDG